MIENIVMDTKPIKNLVSVVIPSYNDAPYLRECLDDMLNQTYEDIEIIVVNDGSTDNTEEIVLEYAKNDKRVKYFSKENGGTGTALNFGFSKAKGEFGTWISSDDRKEADMIETLVGFLKQNRDIEFVTSAFYSQYLRQIIRAYIPDSTEAKGYRNHQLGLPHDGILTGKAFAVDSWLDINFQQCYQGVNFMFTMSLKDRAGLYLEIPGEDYYMAAMMGLLSRVGYIDKCLGTHRNPPDSLSVVDRSCVAQADFMTRGLISKRYKPIMFKNIPKVAHFYWGSDKLSFMRFLTIFSFKKQNPEWSVNLYVPKKITKDKIFKDTFHQLDVVDYRSETDHFPQLKELPIKIIEIDFPESVEKLSEAQKSDYARWRLLYKFGGFWSDMDILFVKPLSSFDFNTKENSNLDCTVSVNVHHGHQIGFFLSVPKNPMFKKVLELSTIADSTKYQGFGCDLLNQMGTTEQIEKDYSLKLLNVSQKTFYLIDHNNLNWLFSEDHFEELSQCDKLIGIHWYGGHTLSQKYNNLLTHENYKNYSTTFCKFIEKVLK